MGSRRTTTTRSASWNGRSSNGDDTNGSSRPSSYSYISNVRPVNRSTLCSVMAQLTEETQPFFETTLKSKAVSESSNVKFSCVVTGYPTPQVNWYKDEMQLDRFCGLPKYEIFHNGKNHSLHIYNCTVEDAAIYQASAINNKGIVSCSGVLEVGEMNEFKIHQRYFAKLKQKAENRRREAEGKENLEPLRTISPDRIQRKRRSTMEAFLSMPGSMEDEGDEESHQPVAVENETRLQVATVENTEEKPVTHGQAINENGNKAGTCHNDTAQMIFTAYQPKTPFVKKKIKISNSAKVAKADKLGEKTPEERRAKDKTSTPAALACRDSLQSKGNSEKVVKKAVNSSIMDSDSKNVTEQHLKSVNEEAKLVERPSKDGNVSQRKQVTGPVSPVPLTSTSYSASGTDGKRVAKHEKEAGHKDTEKNLEVQKQSPCLDPNFTSTQLHSSVASTLLSVLKEDIIKTEDDKAMDIDEKSDTSTGAPLAHEDLKSVNTLCESRTALPQRPCEQAGDLLSEKETSPCQENMSKSQPALLSEVTQAHTKMNRNDAPVNLEPPPDQCTTNTQPPQKTTSEREITTDDGKTLSLHRGLQAAIDKRTQDKWDHSRRSNERPVVLFTDQQNSPLASPNGGENIRECNVSSTALQCKVDTAVKTVEGTEIQVDRKIEGKKIDKSLVQADNVAPKGKVVETESVALRMVEQTETEETRDSLDKDAGCVIVEESCKEANEPLSKMAEESSSELQNVKPDDFETVLSHLTNNPENANKLEQIIGFNEITKPVSKVISIAELLRSQIKSLDHTLADSVPTIPVLADFVQEPTTTATETCQELINDNGKCKPEVKKSLPDRKTEIITDNTPPEDTKATLVEVYHQLSKTDQDQIKTQDETSPPVQSLQKPFDIETTGLHSSARKYNEGLTDIVQQTGASNLVPSIDFPVVSLSESENVKHIFFPSASKDELSNRPKSISNLSGTVSEGSGTPVKASRKETITECSLNDPVQGKDVEVIQKLTAEINLNSKTESGITEMNSTTILDQCKIEEHDTNRSSMKDVQRFPSPSLFSTDTQENNIKPPQQDCSMFEDFSRSESLTNPAPEDIPLVKKRNCVSPIPSATAQELASGARRKILITKAKPEEAASAIANQAQKKEVFTQNSKLSTSLVTPSMSPILSRRSPLLQPAGERTSPVEKRSPLLSRRRTASETQAPSQQPSEEVPTPKTEGKPKEKEKHDPFRAPQVIRKMRGETFADASGHLKLWCQFFNVLSDSTIKWYKNEEEIAQMKRSAGDETQVNLAIVQVSSRDSGVYGCSITNEYGTDSTDTLLSGEILAGMSLREDLGVGEEIEMTPLIFNKGVADSGIWGNKLFGRIMMQESHIGDGCSHKVWRAKVIYGLEPVFESGNTCIIKVRNPIAYGGKEESCLIERNLTIVKQECKIQNLAREYCKIFSAEARGIENFGPSLEVVPVYLMYRPANTVPYATVEVDLTGDYQKYSVLDHTGRIDMRTGSKVEEKCCALQHWIFQWTNGNLLLTRLEGVDTKITNVGISVKSTGHQGLSVEGNPKVFEEFVSQHQCNYFCGLLGLRSLKVMDSLLTPTKPKGSRSPLLQRKMAAGSSSPQTGRKAVGSPRLPRKTEQEGGKTPTKQKATDAPNVVKMA